jgi:hypothetical protein
VPFQQMMRSIYERFVDEKVEACVQRCREDLFGMTRYSCCVDVRRCAALNSVMLAPVLIEFNDFTVPHPALFLCMCPTACSITIASRRSLSTPTNTHIVPFHARYVTFDQEDKGGASTLYRLLPTPQRMAKMVEVLILTKDKQKRGERACCCVCACLRLCECEALRGDECGVQLLFVTTNCHAHAQHVLTLFELRITA